MFNKINYCLSTMRLVTLRVTTKIPRLRQVLDTVPDFAQCHSPLVAPSLRRSLQGVVEILEASARETRYDIIISMLEEANIVKDVPQTFPACKGCHAVLKMIAKLTDIAHRRYIPGKGSLAVQVRCEFVSDNPTDGVTILGKTYPISVEENPHFWAHSPPVDSAKCPVIE